MQKEINTIQEYLDSLPEDRKATISKLREVIIENLPKGYEETINWGMITYQVPLDTYPNTYNKKPLMYAALASQKKHMALYLTCVYSNEQETNDFKKKYKATGKKLDMGKSCVRFKTLDDLPLEVIAETIKNTPVDKFIKQYEESRKK